MGLPAGEPGMQRRSLRRALAGLVGPAQGHDRAP